MPRCLHARTHARTHLGSALAMAGMPDGVISLPERSSRRSRGQAVARALYETKGRREKRKGQSSSILAG